MNELFESMNIDMDQKVELQEAFDKAVLVKTTEMLDEHVEAKVAEKEALLKEEFDGKITLLEDSLDGYLDQVVEEFIAENASDYEAQITEEKTKTLLEMFDNMVKIVGIDMLTIQEGKAEKDAAEYDASAEAQVDKLTEKVADMADKLVESKRESDKYLQAGIINESKEGLTMLESAKFEKLAEMVSFERTAEYLEKLETIKESIIDSRSEDFDAEAQEASLPGNAFKQPEAVDIASATDFSKYV